MRMTYVIADTQCFRVHFRDEFDELFVFPKHGDMQGASTDRVLADSQQFSAAVVLVQKFLGAVHVVNANRSMHLLALILSSIIVLNINSEITIVSNTNDGSRSSCFSFTLFSVNLFARLLIISTLITYHIVGNRL